MPSGVITLLLAYALPREELRRGAVLGLGGGPARRIRFGPGEHHPGDPRQLIGQGDGGDIGPPARLHCPNPAAQRVGFARGVAHHGPRAMNQ